jgi:hypothetical protein
VKKKQVKKKHLPLENSNVIVILSGVSKPFVVVCCCLCYTCMLYFSSAEVLKVEQLGYKGQVSQNSNT